MLTVLTVLTELKYKASSKKSKQISRVTDLKIPYEFNQSGKRHQDISLASNQFDQTLTTLVRNFSPPCTF